MWSLVERWLNQWPPKGVLALKFGVDLVLWTAAAPLAFLLRLDRVDQYIPSLLFYTLVGFSFKGILIGWSGLHRQSWRRVGVRDLGVIVQVVGVFAAAMFLFVWLWFAFRLPGSSFPLPRSIPLLEALISVFLLGGWRLGVRLVTEGVARHQRAAAAKPVLIVGAGEAGTLMAREMLRHPESGLEPVGFVDDDPNKWRLRMLGLPVFGAIERLPEVVRQQKVQEVLIAMPSAPGKVIRQVVELCRQAQVEYRIVPALYEILSGRVSLTQIREVRVEDLLRREPVHLDLEGIASMVAGKRVLVTGAGGSIGAEIVRQVARFRPASVVLLGRGENSLYELLKEIEHSGWDLRYEVVVADVRDRRRLCRIFQAYRPHLVFHAAAHKHVPLMEWNPEEAILNNVLGTRNVVECAQHVQTERLVNISTDKAVNPTSVMGVSKRIAEYIVQAAAQQAQEGQVFVSVRFGNVLGSRGSVVPLFQEQIRRGGPVTVTHPEMRRYFMTIPEAVQLVLQAAYLGDNGAVYVLDMGEPVKIVDLARDLIRLSGFTEDEIPIVFTGPRPGEKLFEELLTAEEGVTATKHAQIFVARTTPVEVEWLQAHLAALEQALEAGDISRLFALLQEMVPTYRPWMGQAGDKGR